MCFAITTPEKIAKKDITCWKLFEKLSPEAKNDYRSSHQGSLYALGQTYTVKKFGIKKGTIDEGIHSYSNRFNAERRANWFGLPLVKCIIPKGTKYYHNKYYQEYVSLKIKLIKGQ